MCALSVETSSPAVSRIAPGDDPLGLPEFSSASAALIASVEQTVLGKRDQVITALATLLSGGHLLIEDVPGVGKTTLAHALAHALGLSFQRIQFTSDLMPADIIGVSVFDRAKEGFRFQSGPIFTQVLLADEINRATPKTQSALLEAMGEGRVTHDGESRELPDPFFVIATQNPNHQIGTFPLPESQLDRFTTRIALGYPEATAERELLRRGHRDTRTRPCAGSTHCDGAGSDSPGLGSGLGSGLGPSLAQMQQFVSRVTLSDALLDYVQGLLKHSRDSGWYTVGLSPRAGISLVQMAQATAAMNAREFVVPEDVQRVLPGVVAHRLRLANQPPAQPGQPPRSEDIARPLLEQVPVD